MEQPIMFMAEAEAMEQQQEMVAEAEAAEFGGLGRLGLWRQGALAE
jgi:hypothetical protein